MNVEELMTPDPRSVQATAAVGDVMGLLEELDVRHIPVLDGKHWWVWFPTATFVPSPWM